MNQKIIRRILKNTNCPELLEILTDTLSLSDLQSLLLEVYRKRTETITPAELLRQYAGNRFVRPSEIDPKRLNEFEWLAYSLLPEDFEILELSPVSPLGSASVVGPVDQNNILSTIRNTEVCADSSNVLALESALRRKEFKHQDSRSRSRIRLCANHRLLRTQLFSEAAAFPHFRLLSLCIAGRDEGHFAFELDSLQTLLSYFIRLLENSTDAGSRIGEINIELAVRTPGIQEVLEPIINPLFTSHPEVSLRVKSDPEENWRYYSNLRFKIFTVNPEGESYFICDGGDTAWTGKLLSDRKERFMISGFGSERFLQCFPISKI